MPHYFNFQGSAVFGYLAFLGSALALLLAAIAYVILQIAQKKKLAGYVVTLVLIGAGAYLATLLAFSLASHAQVLDLNEEKYFCEVDCHLAYSVLDVTTTKTLGNPPNQSTAQGVYYVVTLKVRFDETTIAKWRPKDVPLRPNPRTVAVLDDQGKGYAISPEGLRALESAQGAQVPLTKELRPGEFYTTTLVFDLPADVKDPHLMLSEAAWETHFLIGHENSFFHKKTTFRLSPSKA